jgi:hypothetical protein
MRVVGSQAILIFPVTYLGELGYPESAVVGTTLCFSCNLFRACSFLCINNQGTENDGGSLWNVFLHKLV